MLTVQKLLLKLAILLPILTVYGAKVVNIYNKKICYILSLLTTLEDRQNYIFHIHSSTIQSSISPRSSPTGERYKTGCYTKYSRKLFARSMGFN